MGGLVKGQTLLLATKFRKLEFHDYPYPVCTQRIKVIFLIHSGGENI